MALTRAEKEFHRKTAVQAFNEAWELLDMKVRSAQDDRRMLHLVHVSRYHWGLVGNPGNIAVADWQISRAYASLGQADLSLRFAKSCLETCEKEGLAEIIHTAHEAMARAHAVGGDSRSARKHLEKARALLEKLPLSAEDQRTYLEQIRETESML